jgi:hypothetical protein
LMCLRRAGADIILTYFALQAARCLCGEKRWDLSYKLGIVSCGKPLEWTFLYFFCNYVALA